MEIIQVCKEVNPRLDVYRAIFSEITKTSVLRALNTLARHNKNVSDAVEARSELDLRIGEASNAAVAQLINAVFFYNYNFINRRGFYTISNATVSASVSTL